MQADVACAILVLMLIIMLMMALLFVMLLLLTAAASGKGLEQGEVLCSQPHPCTTTAPKVVLSPQPWSFIAHTLVHTCQPGFKYIRLCFRRINVKVASCGGWPHVRMLYKLSRVRGEDNTRPLLLYFKHLLKYTNTNTQICTNMYVVKITRGCFPSPVL